MAEFTVSGRMAVKSLKKQFKEAFGATLRVYNGKRFADDDATLASIRGEGAKGGEIVCKGDIDVKFFEDYMKEIFGITVQVANADDTKLAKNDLTLSEAGK